MAEPILVNGEPVNYAAVPAAHMRDGVERYIEQGIPGGSFLMAVIEGDLFRAAACADTINQRLLWHWCFWFHNYAPHGSFGSPESAAHWMQHRREARQERIAQ